MRSILAWVLLAAAAFFTASCSPAARPRGEAKAGGSAPPPAVIHNDSAHAGAAETVEVKQAWSTTGNDTLAAYMKIINHGTQPETVVGVSAGELGEASLHRTTFKDDMARMEMVQRVEIPAGGTVELAPNGLHIMVKVAPNQKGIGVNDEWQLVLRLESGREIPVRVVGRLNTIDQVLRQEKVKVLDHSEHGGEHSQ